MCPTHGHDCIIFSGILLISIIVRFLVEFGKTDTCEFSKTSN